MSADRRRTRRTFTAHGRHGPLTGTQYPNGTVAYRWDDHPEQPSILPDLEQLKKNHQVKGIIFT